MITMTCSDDSEFAYVVCAAPEGPADGKADGADTGWTPAVARIISAIAQTLDAFPEALAAVQATIKRLRSGAT